MIENIKGQGGLWAYSISGELPIFLVAIKEARNLGLIRQLLQVHAYWRMHGLTSDLVIINEGGGGYAQPLRKEIEHLIQSFAFSTEIDRSGGIFLRSGDLIPAEDLTLLLATARVALVAARGTLSQQLRAAQDISAVPARLNRTKNDHRYKE